MTSNIWVFNPRFHDTANVRLFCFSYGGGGASIYRHWEKGLPHAIDVCPVQLPGRENRLNEILQKDMTLLIPQIAEALAPLLNRPFAFFGHSLGAVVSFELARYVRRVFGKTPIHLFMSGSPAPQLPKTRPPLHVLPEEEFKEVIRTLNGTPSEVWDHPEFVEFILPVLRADFTMYETYVYSPDEPFTCPITVFGGQNDPMAEVWEVEAWSEQTMASFRSQMFPGDHFFIQPHHLLLLNNIAQTLTVGASSLEENGHYSMT